MDDKARADREAESKRYIKRMVELGRRIQADERQQWQQEDRQQYSITNHFTAPVGDVAQGQASIGFITQSNAIPPRDQLVELARLITEVRVELGDSGSKETAAALQVVEAEASSEHTDGGSVKAAIARVAGFVERAGSSAAGGAFLAFARAHGWLP